MQVAISLMDAAIFNEALWDMIVHVFNVIILFLGAKLPTAVLSGITSNMTMIWLSTHMN